MMNVKTQTSTSTKNSTVNAVGNLNRRLGSAVTSPVSSGLVCVPAVMMPAPDHRRSPTTCAAFPGRAQTASPFRG